MQIDLATTPEDFSEARELIVEYAESLDFDLEFQQFNRELDDLAIMYGAANSALLLARSDKESAGIVALRPFDERRCEMKRMWVRPQFRRGGVARKLSAAIITFAQEFQYHHMLLDTTARMQPAIELYTSLGFVEIPPYCHNPIKDAKYYSLDLAQIPQM